MIRRFDELDLDALPLVGGKNASLAELYRRLRPTGVNVPNGFAVTVEGFQHFMTANGLRERIRDLLRLIPQGDLRALSEGAAAIRRLILDASMPSDLAAAILAAYTVLGDDRDVAVRSSATAEDLPDASFAGQQETYLNVRGATGLIDACRRCFASLYTERAISYRADHGIDQASVALSVGVQQMVRSDLGTSGVMFTLDTETGFRDVVLINASYGLGEPIVQGAVTPDEYCVFKPTLKTGHRPILRKRVGSKEFKLIYDEGGSRGVRTVPVAAAERTRVAASDDDILTLARWACAIEDHYSVRHGRPTPMDIEWAKDGRTGELFILQARPETVHARTPPRQIEEYRLDATGPMLASGRSVGARIAAGPARHIADVSRLVDFQRGEVLVADKTDPDWEPIMKKAAAIVTNRGGRTCHAAIVSRELGIPAVVGTGRATEVLEDGHAITVSCAQGDTGFVYDGILPFSVHRSPLALDRPQTRIMMNVGNPDEAFTLASLPNDGVGLARLEFIIATTIGVHPMALVHYEQLGAQARAEVDRVTGDCADRPDFFVDRLAQGIGTLAAAFHPKDVIVRLSDFKTNEYARLAGGAIFEPAEENPMLGFRGASRYYDPRYRDGFALECRALLRVRTEMGLHNVKVMIPFCRTLEEARLVTEELERHGLKRGDNGLELYMMVEVPSNVLLLAEFSHYFDGFSIGSNDLTQLTLGVDRDSEIVSHVFDERDPAVRLFIGQAIQQAKRAGRKIGICGQAPSDYPEFVEFLLEWGIDALSLNPDAVAATTPKVLEIEQRIASTSSRVSVAG
jgi:pyruvate,water dikinase